MLAKVRFKDYRFLSVNPRSVLARPEYWQFSFFRTVPDFPRPKTIHTGQQSGSFVSVPTRKEEGKRRGRKLEKSPHTVTGVCEKTL